MQIDIHLGPALVPGKLKRHSICSCGRDFIKRTTPIGKFYQVDVKSVRWAKFECHGCGKKQEIRIVDVWDTEFLHVAWMPLAIFDLDIAIRGPRKPESKGWQPVIDNKIAPKQVLPGIIQ